MDGRAGILKGDAMSPVWGVLSFVAVLWMTGCVRARVAPAGAGAVRKPVLESFLGTTPVLDGVLAPGEWADATPFTGGREWVAEFSPVTRDADLSLRGWVKHDAERLWLAFEVTDDRLYGIETPRWLPPENPRAHELTREGFPWFGDELEVLINAPGTWRGNESSDGTAASWQMVCNLTKSRLGGVGVGGLLEGEPRSESSAWELYRRWILEGAQSAAARARPDGRGYVVEWSVRFDRCVERSPGRFYAPGQGTVEVGFNIALGDLDDPESGRGNFGNFHHEQWWAGARGTRTQKDNFGTLRLMGLRRRR
jgi:solute:Na+ symporter, SSS family